MAGRGGKRANAGRKGDPAKDLKLGAKTAQKFLNDIKHEAELKEIFTKCGDARLKTYIIMRMREWAYGKPKQEVEVEGGTDNTVRMIVEYVGGDV